MYKILDSLRMDKRGKNMVLGINRAIADAINQLEKLCSLNNFFAQSIS